MEKSIPKHRLAGLDGLRAIAVALVIISHCYQTLHVSSLAVFERFLPGKFGVNIFFVLSGFLITWLLLKEESKTGTLSLNAFYTRRVFRILPPAFLYLAALGVLTVAGVFSVKGKDFAACVFFVRNIFDDHPFSYQNWSDQTSHYWSLSVEEQFYLFWPMLLLLFRGRLRWLVGPIILLLAVGGEEVYHRRFHWPIFSAMSYLNWFGPILIGCMLAIVRAGNGWSENGFARLIRHWWAPAVAIPVAIGLEFAPVGAVFKPILEAGCYAIIINYLLERPASNATRLLSIAPLSYMGRLSYSLYLWQQIFCWADPALPRRWFERFPLDLILTASCAALSYHLVEQPALRLRDRLFGASRRTEKTVVYESTKTSEGAA